MSDQRQKSPVHLLKPALRANDIYDLLRRQQENLRALENGDPVYPIWTSRKPTRIDELKNGGSLYWIIKQNVICRQDILDMVERPADAQYEKISYFILCRPELVRTQSYARKPFQGWRYLPSENAPDDIADLPPLTMDDLDQNALDGDDLSPEMEGELRRLGLL